VHTVKLRTKVTKGAGSTKAVLAMAYKLLDAAQERWRRSTATSSSQTCSTARRSRTGIKVTDDATHDNHKITEEKVAA